MLKSLISNRYSLFKTNVYLLFVKNIESFGSRQFNKQPRPNYFLCIKINNQEIVKAVDDCQKEIIKNNPHIEKAAIRIETLHITLMAMHLKDKNQIEFLNKKLLENRKILETSLQGKSLEINFQGLSTFRNQVVYVDLEKNDNYKQLLRLQNELVKIIEKWDILLFESKNFTPHLTLLKLSKFKNSHKKGIKKIDKNAYEHMSGQFFGIELFDTIHLCNMYEKQSNGFYKIESSLELFDQNKQTINN